VLLGMIAKPLSIAQSSIDLIEQIAHAVLSSFRHIAAKLWTANHAPI
jgi:hypothetical protein